MLDIVDTFRVMGCPDICYEDSGHLGALCCKTSRRVVLDVIALRDDLQDLGPGLLVHIRVVVDDP